MLFVSITNEMHHVFLNTLAWIYNYSHVNLAYNFTYVLSNFNGGLA